MKTNTSISIHALLAESDARHSGDNGGPVHFYPRSPCGERRKLRNPSRPGKINFYPRSPCGERQPAEHHASSQQEFLSTLSLRRATPQYQILDDTSGISIHALLAESDGIINRNSNLKQKFLSTLSLRRATTWARGSRITYVISIHALLAESDCHNTRF